MPGLSGFDVSGWYAFYFPARTPVEIVRKAHADTVAALADAKGKLDSTDTKEINEAYDRLVKSSHKLAEVMYQQASQSGGATGGAQGASGAAAGSSSGGDDNVIDADFVDVDEKK